MDSAAAAFDRGDYTLAAQSADDDRLRGAALVMLGAFEAGLPLIEAAPDGRSRFCSAIVYWESGRSELALTQLQNVQPGSPYREASNRLARIIRRNGFRILLQARDDPKSPGSDAVGAMRSVPFAEIVTAGTTARADIRINSDTTIEDVCARLPEGWEPDIYLCDMIEDHPPPLGIERAPFPTIFSTQDFDRHFHHMRHLLPLFDAAVAFGSVFHAELAHLVNGRAFVCPLLMGLDETDVPADDNEKICDIFVSGSLFNHSRGKTERLWTIAQLPDEIRVELRSGHLTYGQYLNRLRRAKFTFTYVQNWGITNSRAFEAISQNCAAFYQAGGELGIFLGDHQGAIPYGTDDFAVVLKNALDQWDSRIKNEASAGMAQARAAYGFTKTRRRYLALLVANSTLIKKSDRRRHPTFGDLRYPTRSPLRIPYAFDGDLSNYTKQQENFRKSLGDANDYARRDACGESFLYSHLIERQTLQLEIDDRIAMAEAAGPAARTQLEFLRNYKNHHVSPLLESAYSIYRDLARDHPNRIAAHFNWARLANELGRNDESMAAFDTIIRDTDLRYEPDDLLFWREFKDASFDYERMMFAIRRYVLSNDPVHLREIERTIREGAVYSRAAGLESAKRDADALALLGCIELTADCLPALWSIKFRLLARSSMTTESEELADEILQKAPWILALHGSDIVAIADECSLSIAKTREQVGNFLRRLS